jgi:hypothetical protein
MIAGAAGALIAALLWAPDNVRGWIAGVLAAVLAGVGVEFVLELLRTPRRKKAPSEPVAVTVALDDCEFVSVDSPQGPRLVPASGHSVRVVVEGIGGQTAVLTGMRPVIISRVPPSGEIARLNAGLLKVRRFRLDLDDTVPQLLPAEPGITFPFTVSASDPEVFDIHVQTEQWDAAWVLELDWTCAGQAGVIRVDLKGSPIRTIARPRAGQR